MQQAKFSMRADWEYRYCSTGIGTYYIDAVRRSFVEDMRILTEMQSRSTSNS